MDRRYFLGLLAGLPLVGGLFPKAQAAEPVIDVGGTAKTPLPWHFPREIVIVDEKGVAHPVPVAVVDDVKKYPDDFFTQTREDNRIIFKIQLPLIAVTKDGMVITVFAFYHEDFTQITEQLTQHYNRGWPTKDFFPVRPDNIVDNMPTIQELAWPDHFHSATMPEALRILKWRMHLKPAA